MNEDTLEEFKKIVKEYDGLEVFVGKGKKQTNIESIDTKDLYNDVLKWGERSKKGLCCGIFGCVESIDTRCRICLGGYCNEHKNMHFHSAENDGMILREDKES